MAERFTLPAAVSTRMNRRRVLRYTGGLLVGGAIGGLASVPTTIAAVPAPDVPGEQLEAGGWEQTDDSERQVFEREMGTVTVRARARTLRYVDRELTDEVEQKTLGAIATPLSVFAATRIRIRPDFDNLPAGIGRGTVLDAVESNATLQFEDELAERGLENVRRTGEGGFEVDTGETARLTEYAADYTYDAMSFEVEEGSTVDVPGGSVTVAGALAVWNHGGASYIAAGAYPAENVDESVSEDLSEAITVSVDVDLGVRYTSPTTGPLR